MYNIMLADDELPALRFLETIIKKYATDFSVICQHRDGASALSWLKDNPYSADVLITDIRMPDMDGIALAKAARQLRPDLHIVIVSGYSEFEYAHGAIEASVDDYILKPVSVSHMKELLLKIKDQLDGVKGARCFRELTALMNGSDADQAVLHNIFGSSGYYFALIRLGNVLYPQEKLQETSLLGTLAFDQIMSLNESSEGESVLPFNPDIIQKQTLSHIEGETVYFLKGRDNKEFLLFAKEAGSVSAYHKIIKHIAGNSGYSTVTVIMAPTGIAIEKLGSFYLQASKLLRHTAVIGHYHEAVLALPKSAVSGKYPNTSASSNTDSTRPTDQITPTILRRLELNVSENNQKEIHNIFLMLGSEWDKNMVTQRQSYVMMNQILHLVEAVRMDHWKDTDQIMTEADALTNTSGSYQEMMESLYMILYNPEEDMKQRSPEDIYNYAIRTIQKKFNQPVNIQTVCSEIGISQTYLSRLFRKYGNTSFNAYLINCRMDNARKLLTEQPDIPLHQVASCVGYDDYAYFSKVFRQITGMSPSQFQSSLKAGTSPAP